MLPGDGGELAGLMLAQLFINAMSLLHQVAPEHRYREAAAMRVILINASSMGLP
jgi:hypothetical protein